MSRIGCEHKLLDIDFYEFGKEQAEYLFLFSDGITDVISDDRFEEIIMCSTNIGQSIMNEALTIDSHCSGLNPEEYYQTVLTGKDNASLVLRKRN